MAFDPLLSALPKGLTRPEGVRRTAVSRARQGLRY